MTTLSALDKQNSCIRHNSQIIDYNNIKALKVAPKLNNWYKSTRLQVQKMMLDNKNPVESICNSAK